jgi:hypothetical protein
MPLVRIFEPRMERAGLFSEEYGIERAIKELKNTDLSYKRSTRGYTLLYKGKPANPAIAGKVRNELEKALHQVHGRYIKNIASRDLAKHDYNIEQIEDSDVKFELLCHQEGVQDKYIRITTNYQSWLVTVEIEGFTEETTGFLQEFQVRLGRRIS